MTPVISRPLAEPFKSCGRGKLEEWFLPHFETKFTLQELSDGVAYGQLISHLYPLVLDLKKLKSSKREMDRLHNWKMIQQAFARLKVNKRIVINERMMPNSASNLDFCRWFIQFWEDNRMLINSQAEAKGIDNLLITPRTEDRALRMLTQMTPAFTRKRLEPQPISTPVNSEFNSISVADKTPRFSFIMPKDSREYAAIHTPRRDPAVNKGNFDIRSTKYLTVRTPIILNKSNNGYFTHE